MLRRAGTIVCLLASLWAAFCAVARAEGPAGSYLGEPHAQYRILVIGDILGGGLWSGMLRMSVGAERLAINGRYKEESGLARPEIYDWASSLPGIVESNPADILVVMIGTNDRQDIRTADGVLAFGSPEWQAGYRANVDALLTAAREANLKVYWVELPPLPEETADLQIKLVNMLQREQTEAAGFRFLDFRRFFATEDDKYTDSGVDADGQFRRLRSRSTIKFLKVGNNRLADEVLAVIAKDIDIADGKASPDEAPAPVAEAGSTVAPQQPGVPAYSGPIFGQAAADGEALVVKPEDLPAGSSTAVARLPVGLALPQGALTPEIVIENLRLTARPGSAAEKLFTIGTWPDAPPGRVDNYQLPAKSDQGG